MGVRQLTTFIKDPASVPDGYIPVSIIDECKNFKGQPEIIIDILGCADLIANFEKNKVDEDLAKLESLCGGRFSKYRKTCEILFKNLSEVANLVFFEDGTVKAGKLESYKNKYNKYYQKDIKVIDKINKGVPLTEIIKEDFNRISTHITIAKETAKKYGKFIIARTRECDAEIVKYANENKSFAVLADDSDFLIFEGDWRYFSLRDLNIADLKTMEYNKRALWNTLGLENLKQKVLLATIGGNDYTSFDDLCNFHMWLTNGQNSVQNRFPAIAMYIKDELNNLELSRVIEKIASHFRRDRRQNAREKVSDSIEMYQTNFTLNSKDDLGNFVFKIVSNDITKFTLSYCDLRSGDFPNRHDAEMKLFTKQAGIILKSRNKEIELNVMEDVAHNSDQKRRKLTPPDPLDNCPLLRVTAKRTHDGSYDICEVKPDYPPFVVPPLNELLSPENKNYKNHETTRWKLLQWAIQVGEEEITKIPQFVHDILTLNFMRKSGFIKVFEADLFLLSIKTSRDESHEKVLDKIPKKLNKRAFQLSFLFSEFRSRIMKTLSVCGLERFKTLTDYDGVIFHNLYLKYPTLSENATVTEQLGDLMNHRVYAQPKSTTSKNTTI